MVSVLSVVMVYSCAMRAPIVSAVMLLKTTRSRIIIIVKFRMEELFVVSFFFVNFWFLSRYSMNRAMRVRPSFPVMNVVQP